MASLFDVDIYNGRVDPRDLDTDSATVYRDPKFNSLLELSDREVLIPIIDRLDAKPYPVTIDRLAAMLFLLNTPESWRVLVHADFESIKEILLSRWVSPDEYVKNVVSNRRFAILMSTNDNVLAADVDDLGVTANRIRKFPAILLLLDTVSSWTLLAHVDEGSILAAVESKTATARRINVLQDELDRLGRSLQFSIRPHENIPPDVLREIVLRTHDIAQLSEMQKASSTYAKILNEPAVLQQLADWWMSQDYLKMGYERWPLEDKPQTFREFRRWVISNFYTSLCYQERPEKTFCFLQMVRTNDTDTWNIFKRTVTRDVIEQHINSMSPDILIESGNREVAQYVLDNKLDMGTSAYGVASVPYVLTIVFGTADDLRKLLSSNPPESYYGYNSAGREPTSAVRKKIYTYLVMRPNYDREITKILLDSLAQLDEEERTKSIVTTYVGKGPTSMRWIPELITDLENDYYPYYSNFPSVQVSDRSHERTNYWIQGGFLQGWSYITIADSLRRAMKAYTQ